MKSFAELSSSQKLTLGVTVAYLATSLIHYQNDRKALGLMFLGYSVANMGAVAMEGL